VLILRVRVRVRLPARTLALPLVSPDEEPHRIQVVAGAGLDDGGVGQDVLCKAHDADVRPHGKNDGYAEDGLPDPNVFGLLGQRPPAYPQQLERVAPQLEHRGNIGLRKGGVVVVSRVG